MSETKFENLKGKIITLIYGAEAGSEAITLYTSDDRTFQMYHEQDCCENVSVEEIIGDIGDLIGSPILLAEEISSHEPDEATLKLRKEEYKKYKEAGNPYYKTLEHFLESNYESETWTFYKLSTVKGSVTIRWYGSSNGFYSEGVSFQEV